MSGKPRNIVLLLADQFRHDAASFAGGPAPTPHLDALAARGATYTHAYTPLPVCAPARQALMRGQRPDAFGSFWNPGFLPAPTFTPGDTLTERLRDAGLACGFVGKWDVSSAHGPQDFGFTSCALKSQYAAHLAQRHPDVTFEGGWMGCKSPLPLEDADTHFFARRAVDFLQTAPDGFFLWVDFGAPHLPCRPSEPFADAVNPQSLAPWPGYDDAFENKPYCHRQQAINWRMEDTPWPEMAAQVARYYGVVAQLDDAVGRIVSALEAQGRLEDTLIVFTSDHGDMCGNHRMLDKHYVLYDDVVRVPLILAGSGVKAGVCDDLVSNCLDLPVTLCDALGIERLPNAHGQPLPGFGDGQRRQHMVCSGNGQQFGMFNSRMITDGSVKYVWNPTDIDEFYDLRSDPGECRNAIGDAAYAKEIAALRILLHEDLRAHGDPIMTDWLAPQLLEGRKHLR